MTGSGTLADPYIIYDVIDLQAMNDDLSAYYELANDIDASATITWNAGAGFLPIGQWPAWPTAPFSGSLDGKGFTISDLYINRPTLDYVGLFGYVDGATIQNVNLSAPNMTGGDNDLGALVGQGEPSSSEARAIRITNCHVSNASLTTAGNNLGGLVGSIGDENYRSVIEDCSATGTFTYNGTAPCYIGGLIGVLGASQLSDCHTSGAVVVTVADNYCAGGLVGVMARAIDIDGCYSSCTVTCPADWGAINGTAGFIGYIDQVGSNCTINITNCYATGDISAGYCAAGFIGSVTIYSVGNIVNIGDCYSTGKVSDTLESRAGGFIGGMGGPGRVQITDCYATGIVECVGLDEAGGFIGFMGTTTSTTISRCYSTGDVLAPYAEFVSGFLGYGLNKNLTISECFATGDILADVYAAGFIFSYGNGETVSDCYARGDVTALDSVDPGAIGFGWVWGTIDNCYSTGELTTPNSSDPNAVDGFGSAITVSDCFWDVESSGVSHSTKGTGKTTVEMKTKSTFTDVGWDFAAIWNINPTCNDSYPCLLNTTPGCPSALGKGSCQLGVLELLS